MKLNSWWSGIETEGAQGEQVGLGVPEQRVRVPAEVGHKDRSVLEGTRDKQTCHLTQLAARPADFTPPPIHSTLCDFVCTVSFSWNALPDSP